MKEIDLLHELDARYSLDLHKISGESPFGRHNSNTNYYCLSPDDRIQTLYIRNTYIEDENDRQELFDFISTLDSLNELGLVEFEIKDLDFLKNLFSLTQLNLNENNIKEIGHLRNLKSLIKLYISNNNISDITPLANLKNLEEIFALDNEIEDINCLSNLKSLTSINFANNKIKNLNIFNKNNKIQHAWFYSNQIEYLSGDLKVSHLKFLGLGKNNIENIDFLSKFSQLIDLQLTDNKIISISPLKDLYNLEDLRLNINKIYDISPLQYLPKLETVSISHNRITSISSLKENQTIKSLNLSNNLITTINDIDSISNLEHLEISSNLIKEIPFLKGLKFLKSLDISQNRIVFLPGWITDLNIKIVWSRSAKRYNGIYLYGNPISNIPIEILKKGKESIQRYFERVEEEGKDYIFEAKLILLGEGSSGKTSLIKRLLNPRAALPKKDKRTRGIEINTWQFKKNRRENHVAHVWDFGGQDVYYPVHRFFITENSVFVLLASTRQTQHNFDYWIPTIYQFGGNSPVIVGQTCHDGNTTPWNDLGFYVSSKNFNIIKTRDVPYHEIDLPNNNKGLNEIKAVIESQITHLPHYGQGVPKSWGEIRETLKNLSDSTPCITFEHFENEYKKSKFYTDSNPNDIIDCCQFLHDIGVILWYSQNDFLRDWVILQPEWVMNAVYIIIDDDKIQQRKGNIVAQDFVRLWSNITYQHKHSILKKMLEIFKIAFPKKHKKEDYIIPARLLSIPPSNTWNNSGDFLRLEYKYKFMPRGLVNQISAELSRYILNESEVWNDAVNFYFEKDTAKCQVIEDFHDRKITIKSSGKDARPLIYLVKDAIENINQEYKGVEAEINVPCICVECIHSKNPNMFPYSKLLEWSLKKDNIVCNESSEKISIDDLLYNVGLRGKSVNNNNENMKKTINLFLASSSELKADREQFELFINRENKRLNSQGIFINLDLWEDFIDSMSSSRLQDEYNKAVEGCDIFISLFFTKVGKFTEEEFGIAYNKFKAKGKPLVYTYFKDENISMSSINKNDINSKFKFEEKLKQLGHFPTPYNNIEDLKFKFKSQLDKILPTLV